MIYVWEGEEGATGWFEHLVRLVVPDDLMIQAGKPSTQRRLASTC